MRQQPDVLAALAVTRFGLGARPGEIAAVAPDPRGWLEAQITPGGAPQPAGSLPGSRDQLLAFQDYQADRRKRRRDRQAAEPAVAMAPEPAMAMQAPPVADQATPPTTSDAQAAFDAARESRRNLRQDIGAEFLARAQHGATTDAGFAERWALFWANGFAVSATKFQSGIFAGPFEREAIRPYVFGRFDDLVIAAEQHPAMLTYLDQVQSVGPNSRAGQRRNAGLNENLAR